MSTALRDAAANPDVSKDVVLTAATQAGLRIVKSAFDEEADEPAIRALLAADGFQPDNVDRIVARYYRLAKHRPMGSDELKKFGGRAGFRQRLGLPPAVDKPADEFGHYFVVRVGGKKRTAVVACDKEFPPAFESFDSFKNFHSDAAGAAALWLADPEKRKFDDIVFRPPPLRADPGSYNLWRGFSVAPDRDPNPELRCSRWLAHVRDVVCAGEDESVYDFLLDVLAAKVQQPATLTEVAIVLRGDQGGGKGTFSEVFASLFGDHAILIDKAALAVGRFNAAMQAKCVVTFDEALWAGSREFVGALKSLVTNRVLMIEPKGVDAIQEPNFVQLVVLTNNDWAWPTELRDRRALMLDVPLTRKGDIAYFQAIRDEQRPGGPGQAALLAFLQQRTVDRNALRRVPKTKALGAQKVMSLTPVEQWWFECLVFAEVEGLPWPARVAAADLFVAYEAWCRAHRISHVLNRVELGKKLAPFVGKNVKVRPFLRDRGIVPLDAEGEPLREPKRRANGYELVGVGRAREVWDARSEQPYDWPAGEPRQQEIPDVD